MTLSFLTQNVRGLGNNDKRSKVFQWLKEQKTNFYFLQETHVSSSSKQLWESEWGHRAFFSGTKSNSEGVAILLNPNLSKDIVSTYTDVLPGRILAVEITIKNDPLILINIYGPNKDNTATFEILKEYLANNNDNVLL